MWMPSTPGTPRAIASRTAAIARAITDEVVADQRRQEAGGAEAAVRARRWCAMRLDVGVVVEQHAAAAVDLGVDEARQQQRAVEVVRSAPRTRASSGAHDRRDAAAVDQHARPLDEALVGEHAAR